MTARQLEARHGVAGVVAFRDSGLGGVVAELRACGAVAVVALRGGQVLSYVPRDGEDALWLSPQARLDGSKAVRGGIPVCWPWFGPHPTDPRLPAHGVARTADWRVVSASGDAAAARLCLGFSAGGQVGDAPWGQLELTLDVVLGAKLEVVLSTHNRGDTAFALTQALHTYLRVGDVAAIRVDGLDGRAFIDQLDGPARDGGPVPLRRQAGPVTVAHEVDRIYLDTGDAVVVSDRAMARRMTVSKRGSASTVVWNPWLEKAARLGDLGPDGHRAFVCIETANAAADQRIIAPTATHVLGAAISVEPL